jgi:tetratricopeptide (TPR) repeat protein
VIALIKNATYDESLFLEGMMPQTTSATVLGLVEQDIQSGRYSQAMKRLVSVSVELSKDLKFLSLLCLVQKGLGDNAGQIKTLEAIADITKTHVAYLDFMAALYAEGRLNEALDVGLYLQEEQLSDVNARYHTRMMVRIYLEFCDYEGVNEIIGLYCETHEMDDLMCWARGFVKLAEGDQNQAVDYFRRAVEMNPSNDQAWVSLAMIHDEMGDRELATANLERGLDVNPNNATGLKMMAKWQRQGANAEGVLNRLNYYMKTHSFDEEMSICYIQLLKECNALDEARFEVEKQILNDPTNTVFARVKNDLLEGAGL